MASKLNRLNFCQTPMLKTDLPIQQVLQGICSTLASKHELVLEAPPGAGKTTIVPLALLQEPWLD